MEKENIDDDLHLTHECPACNNFILKRLLMCPQCEYDFQAEYDFQEEKTKEKYIERKRASKTRFLKKELIETLEEMIRKIKNI